MNLRIVKKYIEKDEVFIERRLPAFGSIFVKIGDSVNSFDTIGEASVVKEAEKLNYKGKLLVKLNQRVYPGDTLCVNSKLFKKEEIKSTISGRVSDINEKEKIVYLEGLSNMFNLIAGVKGVVVDVMDGKSVLIKTPAVVIKAVAGCGEEVAGELLYINQEVLNEDEVTENVRGKIIVVNRADSGAVAKARVMGAVGFVLASCEYSDFLKYISDKINILVLEGFGKMPLIKPFLEYLSKADSVFCVLRTYESMLVIPREKIKNILGRELEYKNHFFTLAKQGDMVQVFIKERYGEVGKIIGFEEDFVLVELASSSTPLKINSSSIGLITY